MSVSGLKIYACSAMISIRGLRLDWPCVIEYVDRVGNWYAEQKYEEGVL